MAAVRKGPDHRKQHLSYLMRETLGNFDLLRIAEFQCPGYLQLSLQLTSRSAGDPKELPKLGSIQPSLSFGNITWNGDIRASDLAGQAIKFFARKIPCHTIDCDRKLECLLPDLQITKGRYPKARTYTFPLQNSP